MGEFIQGGYNIHEHNHVEWSDERLHHEVEVISEILQPWQGPERRAQLQRRMALATNEQIFRYAERHQGDKERDHERATV